MNRPYFTFKCDDDRSALDAINDVAERSAALPGICDIGAGRSTVHSSSASFLASLTYRSEEK